MRHLLIRLMPAVIAVAALAGTAIGGPHDPGTFFAGNGSLSEYDVDGNLIKTYAGAVDVYDVAVSPKTGNLFATKPGDAKLYEIDTVANTVKEVGNYFFGQPSGASFAANQWLYIADPVQDAVLEVMVEIAGLDPLVVRSSIGYGYLQDPAGLTFDANGNMFIGSGVSNIVVLNNTFNYARTLPIAGLEGPAGLDFGPDGKLYVVSVGTASVLEVDPVTGAVLRIFGGGEKNPLQDPRNVAVSPFNNRLLVADSTNGVVCFNLVSGAYIETFQTGSVNAVTAIVPEPATLALAGIGIAALAYRRRKSK